MDITTAREIIATRLAASRHNTRTRAEIDAMVTEKYIEVHPSRDEALTAIRDRKQQHYCAGGCGAAMNSDTLVVQPVDYSYPDAEHVVVNKAQATMCTDCYTGQ